MHLNKPLLISAVCLEIKSKTRVCSAQCPLLDYAFYRKAETEALGDVAFSCRGLKSATLRMQPLCSCFPIGAGIYLSKWMGGPLLQT